jgi:EpsD family peptidyl-prolyl cis-trans isomerase
VKSAGQIIAKVNDQEISIHQLNFVLSHSNGVTKDNLDVAKKQIMNSLVDQTLLNEQALTDKLDRDPQIMMSIEQSKRQILAQAWLEKVAKDINKPNTQEIDKFYLDHPELFAKHKIFKLKECLIGKTEDKKDLINQHITDSKQFDELLKKLDADKISYQINIMTQPAENLPLEELPTLGHLGEGQYIKMEKDNNIVVLTVLSATEQFVDKVKATPIIETFLINQQRKALIEKTMSGLRNKAKIDFIGAFSGEKSEEQKTPTKPEVANSKVDEKKSEDVITKGLKGL